MASKIRNVVVSAKNKKNTVYFSGLAVRNDKYDKKGKEVNVVLKKNVIMKIFFCWYFFYWQLYAFCTTIEKEEV